MEEWVNVISINAQAFSLFFLFFSASLRLVRLQRSGSQRERETEMEKRITDSMENKTTEAPTKIIMIASIVRVYTKFISFFFLFRFYLFECFTFIWSCRLYLLRHCPMFFFVSISLSSARVSHSQSRFRLFVPIPAYKIPHRHLACVCVGRFVSSPCIMHALPPQIIQSFVWLTAILSPTLLSMARCCCCRCCSLFVAWIFRLHGIFAVPLPSTLP